MESLDLLFMPNIFFIIQLMTNIQSLQNIYNVRKRSSKDGKNLKFDSQH